MLERRSPVGRNGLKSLCCVKVGELPDDSVAAMKVLARGTGASCAAASLAARPIAAREPKARTDREARPIQPDDLRMMLLPSVLIVGGSIAK